MTRFLVVLVAISGLGFGVASLPSAYGSPETTHRTTRLQPADAATPTPQPTPTPTAAATPQVLPASQQTLTPNPVLLKQGDTGPRVRTLQARLRQLGWYAGTVTNRYNPRTTTAVREFQAKRKLPATGSVDRPTVQRLRAMTHRPTHDELANRTMSGQGDGGAWTTAALDPRCRVGRALCVDKTSRTIRWVVGGEVRKTMAVRFGSAYTPTREGVFHVTFKSRDHVSTLYNTPMPFAMFFSGGQAVHYSSDFAARGYAGASHGCVNVRDYHGVKWLFDQVRVGDKVVIYWA